MGWVLTDYWVFTDPILTNYRDRFQIWSELFLVPGFDPTVWIRPNRRLPFSVTPTHKPLTINENKSHVTIMMKLFGFNHLSLFSKTISPNSYKRTHIHQHVSSSFIFACDIFSTQCMCIEYKQLFLVFAHRIAILVVKFYMNSHKTLNLTVSVVSEFNKCKIRYQVKENKRK